MATIERLHRTAPLDLAKLEEDVIRSLPAIKAAPSGPMPDYVEHEEGVTRVGALSAEAVVRDYEAAAREIEAMGAELISAAKKCEAMTAEVHNPIAFMRDTAASYREEAKKIFRAHRRMRDLYRARPRDLRDRGTRDDRGQVIAAARLLEHRSGILFFE